MNTKSVNVKNGLPMKETKEKLFKEYYNLHEEFKLKYGERIAILMQVGKFYEMYAPADYSFSSNIQEIAAILNCNMTWKDTERMSGFPLVSLDKNVKRLTDNDFTVVIIDQIGTGISEDGSKKERVQRVIKEVLSKSTITENNRLRNNIMSIFFRRYGKDLFSFGISVIDSNISQDIITHDIHSLNDDKGFSLDSAIRFVAQYDPVECIFVTKYGDCTDDIQRHLGLNCPVYKRDVQMIDPLFMDNDSTAYSDPVSCSLGALRMFLAEHKQDSNIQYNVIPFQSNNYLDLCSTAIKQLDLPMLLSKANQINMTVTAMGNRLLTTRLFTPIKDYIELNSRYDAIEAMSDDKCNLIRSNLKDIPDLDKTHHKMSVGKLSFGQFKTLHETYIRILPLLQDVSLSNDLNLFISFYTSKVQISAKYDVLTCNDSDDTDTDVIDNEDELDCDNVSPTGSGIYENIFTKGTYDDLDQLFTQLTKSATFVKHFIHDATSALNTGKPLKFKIKDRIGLITTQKRADLLEKVLNVKIFKLQKTIIVYTDELRTNLCLCKDLQDEITKLMSKYLISFQCSLYKNYRSTLDLLSKKIAEMDFQQCAYSMAKKFRLKRPHISQEPGILEIHQVRHLLIEIINQDTQYVPNDCLLGSNFNKYGMVLYGVNSCGKTSFLKSVGLAIIMAQAGLFVAADNMVFTPLSKIMTRIAGTDNMERSQSSYIVELEELLSIVRRSDSSTLILGDEMCRGTEVESANAMVFTTLQWLLEKRTLFIAATHLHNIAAKIESDLSEANIYHMKVSFDHNSDVIYDRKLTPGSGTVKYGLEIAKAMGFPLNFMERALAFRENNVKISLNDQDSTPSFPKQLRKSRYNSKKILVKCEACSYQPLDSRCLPLDTHHIEFQCNADNDGFHGTQHKNMLHNLVVVCKECHCKIHKNELEIVKVQGLKGTKILFVKGEKINPVKGLD